MKLSMYSQNIQPTKNQQAAIDTLFTPEKIIKYSAIISNEEKQYAIIRSLEKKIDSLKKTSILKDIKLQKYIDEVLVFNKQIRSANKQENKVSDNQLKKSKKRFLGFHLRSRITVQDFKINNINLALSLSYDLQKFSIGIVGQSFTTPVLNNINNITYESRFYSGAFIEYKFF